MLTAKEQILEKIASIPTDPEKIILFRGEFNDYPSIISGRSRPKFAEIEYRKQAWNYISDCILSPRNLNSNLAPAILQHYGYATDYVDLTTDLDVAIFFATQKLEFQRSIFGNAPPRPLNKAKYHPHSSGYGIIHIFQFPKSLLESKILVDLSTLGSSFLRPQKQSGYLFKLPEPTNNNIQQYSHFRLNIDRSQIASVHREEDLFPSNQADEVYGELVNFKYLSFYNKGTHFAFNLLDLPLYTSCDRDHKRDDLTIFSPEAYFHFQALNIDAAISDSIWTNCEIKDSEKIMVSERTWNSIKVSMDCFDFHDFDFFTTPIFVEICQDYHGKYEISEPPFVAHYLMKTADNRLIKLLTFIADSEKEVPSIYNSHTFAVGPNNKLIHQAIEGDCTCESPLSHLNDLLKVMFVILSLGSQPEIGVPHPFLENTTIVGL